VISSFICGQVATACGGDATAQATCAKAQAAAAAITTKNGAPADAFNNVFGQKTSFASISA
jgi:hypothetical protein